MRRILTFMIAAGAIAAGQDARSVLERAVNKMGNPRSIEYSGSGAAFTLGQNVNPNAPWPRVEVKSFTRVIDYDTPASRIDAVAAQGPAPAQFFSGGKAWGQNAAGVVTPAPQFAAERRLQIWLTPHGFLRGALANNAKAKSRNVSGRKVTEVSFIDSGRRVTGVISADHLVEKVDTWLDNAVLGDMPVETTYSEYRDFGGIQFPARIVQKQGGFPVLDQTVTAVRAGVPANITVPEPVRQAVAPAVKVAAEKLAEGVWYLAGGSHHSVAVEFRDHVAVIEAPQSEERSIAVIAEVKKLLPNKPIRYLVNTHHHFDHSGGLRTYVAEGAAIVTHQVNGPFYQRTLSAKRTLNPDRLSREKKKPKLIATTATHTLTDGARTVQLHHIQGSPHNDASLMAWLPKERILIEVDVYSPAAPNAPPPATPPPAAVNLYENVARLKLDVDRIAALHGRVVPMAEFLRFVGRTSVRAGF